MFASEKWDGKMDLKGSSNKRNEEENIKRKMVNCILPSATIEPFDSSLIELTWNMHCSS